MDLEGQGRIKQVVEQAGTEGVVAVLGANSAAAVEMTAMTLKTGDPSYAGPLAGVALETEVVDQIDSTVYERELALSALAMDVDQVITPLKAIRDGGA
jgi:glycine reductase